MAVGGGDCVPEGIEEKTVAGRSLEIGARPDWEGPAPSTRNPEKGARWFPVPHVKCWAVGSPAPYSPALKCFSFCKETGGGREEGP